MNTLSQDQEVRSNVLGVTGLSRAVLAALFRSRGLFGRDSQLSSAEQAVVQSRLPAIDGIAALPVPALQSPRLKALADYTDARVAGREGSIERSRLLAAGLSSSAILEAAITVDNVRAVFGISRRPAVAERPAIEHRYARAA